MRGSLSVLGNVSQRARSLRRPAYGCALLLAAIGCSASSAQDTSPPGQDTASGQDESTVNEHSEGTQSDEPEVDAATGGDGESDAALQGSTQPGESEPANGQSATAGSTQSVETASAHSTTASSVASSSSTTDEETNTDASSQSEDESSDETISPTIGDGVEFIPWEEFAKSEIGDTGGLESLGAPLSVKSVASTSGSGDEDLLIAIRVEGGDNLVVALDTRARTFRSHWPHFTCGDCLVAASSLGSVILTKSELYGSTDGGYRYFTISEGDFGEGDGRVVRAVDDRVWVHTEVGWLGALFDATEALAAPSWSGFGIASVDRDSALEVTARYITKHSDALDTTTTDVCATVPSVDYGTAYHVDDVVVVPCDEQTVRVTRGFPDEAWETVTLDAPVAWVGGSFVASQSSWYSVAEPTLGQRVGSQSALEDEESVQGYAENPQRAYRITSRGVAVTPGFHSSTTAP